jgi:hypothetical protein
MLLRPVLFFLRPNPGDEPRAAPKLHLSTNAELSEEQVHASRSQGCQPHKREPIVEVVHCRAYRRKSRQLNSNSIFSCLSVRGPTFYIPPKREHSRMLKRDLCPSGHGGSVPYLEPKICLAIRADGITVLPPGLVSFILIDFEPGGPHGRSSSGGLFHFQTLSGKQNSRVLQWAGERCGTRHLAARLVAAELVRH